MSHVERVRDYVRRRVEAADVDDAVAACFLVAWRRWSAAPREEGERLWWLLAIARRVASDLRRASERRARLQARCQEDHVAFAPPCPSRDDAILIASLLGVVDDEDRELLITYYVEEVPVTEIATQLACTPQVVWKRLERARQRLREAAEGRPRAPRLARAAAPGALQARSRLTPRPSPPPHPPRHR